ncbi:YcxB family protein [Pseudoalteromonas luteoviolacea]|uniref:YcxB-like protein domain-containing protein n=1 Tax=Pseudoalteromonas luteoviolacea DSM 6061 TaxID=1365250 RepID=A0A166VF80_9GAMM|nr:YcxB family protein [Pseudoalteromonas luteoviolacea]KZN32623.1 hypothetical protein N475_21545 [Pseudoalteromonas luteoviolacea DSM 6061]KZN50454.1 hypothetical protein N474_03505 [Pseudoalteromonas luteoviolacea CPMOR-2]MBE0385094.1 hypothetical protein [Pseudoalteromonas luteoviolacea DSM 6061]
MFQSEFTLDKRYFQECFDESVKMSQHHKPKYGLIAFLISLGFLSHYLLNQAYLGNFLFLLGVLEGVAFYYKRPWWVARQMLSRASGSKVSLTIDEEGITAENPYRAFSVKWQDIHKVVKTEQGIIIQQQRHNQYISSKVLNDEVLSFIISKAKK